MSGLAAPGLPADVEAPRGAAAGQAARRFGVSDVIAGVSIALVLIPQALAYADLAGMPLVRGLYAAAIPLIVAAPLVSSPYLQTGPVAITSLLTFGALSSLAEPGSARYVALGLGLALVVGVTRVVLGLARAGVVAYLMSQPMLMGFVPGAALLIAASQLPKALGTAPHGDGVVRDALYALGHPGGWRLAAMLIAAGTLVLVLGGRRLHQLFPGVLVAVVVGILASKLAGYDGDAIGSIPQGAPPISLALPWGDLGTLLLPGAVIALVGFAEPASIARTFAALERERWDANRELVSQGAANVAGALSGGFPVGGSFSRSSLNRLAGARSRWSGAVTGIVVLAFLPIAGVLSPLPQAVLAATVIAAVVGLVRLGAPLRLWRISRPQFVIAWVTFGLTLALSPHIERAVLAGVVLSVVVHLWRELRIDVDADAHDGELSIAPRGVLWFGAAQELEDRFLDLLHAHPEARRLRIDLSGLGRIDVTGALALRNVAREARNAGMEITLEGGPPQARDMLQRLVGEHAVRLG